MTLVIIYILTIIISLKIYSSFSTESILRKPTILSFTLCFWLIPFCLTGSLFLALGSEVYFLKGSLNDIRSYVFYLIVYVIFALPVGAFLHRIVINFFRSNFNKSKRINQYLNFNFLRLLLLLSFFGGIYTFYYSENIPLFDLLSGNTSNLLLGRSSIKFNFQGISFIKGIIFNKMALLISLMLFSYFLKSKKLKLLTFISIGLAILSEVYTLEKAPLVFYLLALFLINKFHKQNLNIKTLATFGVFMLIIISILYVLINEGGFSFFSVFNRIIFVPVSGLYYSLDIFPIKHEFLMGASFPNWMTSVFGVESERSARVLMEFVNPDGFSAGTAGVINSVFISEAYANFGKLGLYLSPVLVGYIISILDRITSKSLFDKINPGLKVYFMIYSPIIGGFIDFIWNVSWFFIFLILYFINKKFKGIS